MPHRRSVNQSTDAWQDLASRTVLTCPHPEPDALIVSHRGYVVRLCVPCLTLYCGGSEVRAGRDDGRYASVSQDDGVCLDLS